LDRPDRLRAESQSGDRLRAAEAIHLAQPQFRRDGQRDRVDRTLTPWRGHHDDLGHSRHLRGDDRMDGGRGERGRRARHTDGGSADGSVSCPKTGAVDMQRLARSLKDVLLECPHVGDGGLNCLAE